LPIQLGDQYLAELSKQSICLKCKALDKRRLNGTIRWRSLGNYQNWNQIYLVLLKRTMEEKIQTFSADCTIPDLNIIYIESKVEVEAILSSYLQEA